MPAKDIERVMPDPNTYDIRINDYQRDILMRCIFHTIMTMPLGMWAEPAQKDEALDMMNMLNPSGTTGPLQTTGINSFVL